MRGKIQEIGNLNVVFTALQKEGVKLVNIGPEDIWDGNQNLILGFLWTLIYYFQVRPLPPHLWSRAPSRKASRQQGCSFGVYVSQN